MKPPVGLYVALIVWFVAVRVLIAGLLAQASGAGEQPLTVTGEPKGTASIANCTVPVGTVVPDAGATLAVKVIEVPYVGEFADELTEVEVAVLVGVKTKFFPVSV